MTRERLETAGFLVGLLCVCVAGVVLGWQIGGLILMAWRAVFS